MIESDDFVKALRDIGFDFFTGVPDTILGGIIATLTEEGLYTPAVREDEAVALAAGAYLAGKIPVVVMQNSGLGNAINVLASLNLIYRIPCLLLVSWRGFQGKDAPEHLVIGETMPQLLDTLRIPHRTISHGHHGGRFEMDGSDLYGTAHSSCLVAEKRNCEDGPTMKMCEACE